jgi:hypothetical protein
VEQELHFLVGEGPLAIEALPAEAAEKLQYFIAGLVEDKVAGFVEDKVAEEVVDCIVAEGSRRVGLEGIVGSLEVVAVDAEDCWDMFGKAEVGVVVDLDVALADC